MTHTAKKIAKGLYEYRGLIIDQHETDYGLEWHVENDDEGNLIEGSDTLKEAKAKVDCLFD